VLSEPHADAYNPAGRPCTIRLRTTDGVPCETNPPAPAPSDHVSHRRSRPATRGSRGRRTHARRRLAPAGHRMAHDLASASPPTPDRSVSRGSRSAIPSRQLVRFPARPPRPHSSRRAGQPRRACRNRRLTVWEPVAGLATCALFDEQVPALRGTFDRHAPADTAAPRAPRPGAEYPLRTSDGLVGTVAVRSCGGDMGAAIAWTQLHRFALGQTGVGQPPARGPGITPCNCWSDHSREIERSGSTPMAVQLSATSAAWPPIPAREAAPAAGVKDRRGSAAARALGGSDAGRQFRGCRP
jgi:hypothetical protein